MEKSEITLFAQYSKLLVSIDFQNSKACLEIWWLGYLVKPAWLWYFPEVRNRQGTESGLASTPICDSLSLTLNSHPPMCGFCIVYIYVCFLYSFTYIYFARASWLYNCKGKESRWTVAKSWHCALEILELRPKLPTSQFLYCPRPLFVPQDSHSQAMPQFPQPTCSCTTQYLSEAESLSTDSSMTNKCKRRGKCLHLRY